MRSLVAVPLALLAFPACSSPQTSRPPAKTDPPPAVAPGGLRGPDAFAGLADRAERSRAMFVEVSRVLLHPRCVNCHPSDDSPRQGDTHALHDPPVVRGPANFGVTGMMCNTCHQDANRPDARIPGAKDWHLAPASMAWLGKTPAQICAQLSDPARNGNRTLTQVAEHLGHDALVAWGWAPGHGRAPAPGSQRELGVLFQAWIDSGAVCPEETSR